MVVFGASPQKRSGRVPSSKLTPVSASKSKIGSATLLAAGRPTRRRPAIGSSGAAKRTSAGALTNLGGRLASAPSLGMFHSSNLLADPKAQKTALRHPPIPPPRPLRRAAAVSALQATSAPAIGLAAKASGAGPVHSAIPIAPAIPLQTLLPKKSALSKRALSGGKAPDTSNQTKRRVKFSTNVSAQSTDTNITAKKSVRIGELQQKKRVKKLKRIRSRREGGHGGSGITPITSGILTTSPQDITKHGTIVDVEPLTPTPPAPRILRLNVVGKSSPATGKSSLPTALRRKVKRTRSSVVQQKAATGAVETTAKTGSVTRIRRSVKTRPKVKTSKIGAGSKHTLLETSTHSVVGSSAGLVTRKKTVPTTGVKRRTKAQPINGSRSYGKA
ncbi:uncharacterized protein LOC110188337 [Drosophila serrata]|uniref:uncharacterized protein LOC110188337 n=1 Tax=Drosophila serrata TaxID=7274 RepID=UPI000A1D0337|nr:uncharacterized protein LOC110188337 [Drosophila serrata]